MTAPQMLPLDRRWYRELLVVAALVGGVVGVLGLAYLGITGVMADLVFGECEDLAALQEAGWRGHALPPPSPSPIR